MTEILNQSPYSYLQYPRHHCFTFDDADRVTTRMKVLSPKQSTPPVNMLIRFAYIAPFGLFH
ncbi:uncharacterized protein METZ01_LOCUS84034 [marine metagenome]|uniref:Uncharacterized protein n=1 Tax=marine metagenome TaxID=408172 RepID=A0A381USW3_9ZZZZ